MRAISCTMTGERPIDGSSRTSIFGRDISALPMASICCSPPDRVPRPLLAALLQAREVQEHLVEIPVDLSLVGAQEGAGAQILLDGQAWKDAAAFGHMGDAEGNDLLRSEPVDALAGKHDLAFADPTSPEMARNVVLLPAPLAPMMVTMPSSGTSMSMPLRAATLW